MTGTITQAALIPASPLDVYLAIVDPAIHARFTQTPATGDPVVGGTFTAWAGYIRGRHLELRPGELIVQEWSTTEWPEGVAPSRLEIRLSANGDGTRLDLRQTEVPLEQIDDYAQGWHEYYWEPLRAFFGGATGSS